MDIIFSANNNEEVMILPIVPPDIQVSTPQEHEDFDGINGRLKLIGNMGLRTMTIESFFPVNKNYTFTKPGSIKDGWKYVEFFKKWRAKKVPMRVIVTTKDSAKRLNMACVINDFSWAVDKVGDITYTLEIEEYKFVTG